MSVPDKKFVRDGFIGLVRAGHTIVCQMAREVPNQGSKYTTRVKRLDLHLTGESDFDEQIKQSPPTIWLPPAGARIRRRPYGAGLHFGLVVSDVATIPSGVQVVRTGGSC